MRKITIFAESSSQSIQSVASEFPAPLRRFRQRMRLSEKNASALTKTHVLALEDFRTGIRILPRGEQAMRSHEGLKATFTGTST